MKKRNIILIIIGVILIAAGIFFYLKKNEPEVSYKDVKVRRTDLAMNVEASGTVSPQNRLEIKPPIAGRIEEVLVKEGEVVKKGKVLAWISSTERAALLDSVRTQGAAEIKRWEDLYKPTPVMAPIDGTIILRKVEAGQSFTNTDPIFTMADRLTVKAQIDETDIAQVKKGQRAKVVLDAYSGTPFGGEVVHVAYDATVTNNVTTYIVDILPDETPEFMRSGMTANVSIEVSRQEKILALPLTAIIMDQDGPKVRIRNNDKIRIIPVKTGADNGKIIQILDGLQEDETVLVEDSQKQFSGKKSGSPFMPSRGGGRRR